MSKFRLSEKCLVEFVKFNAEDGYLPLVRYTCLKKKITTFIYICFGNNYFCVFQQLLGTHRWSCTITGFIGSLTVDYSPIDNDRLMSLKAKIVILFLG